MNWYETVRRANNLEHIRKIRKHNSDVSPSQELLTELVLSTNDLG